MFIFIIINIYINNKVYIFIINNIKKVYLVPKTSIVFFNKYIYEKC